MKRSRKSAKGSHEDYSAAQWERLWFSLADRNWRALALVGAQPGSHTLTAANALRSMATKYHEDALLVIDASVAEPSDVPTIQSAIADSIWVGHRVIIALGYPLDHAPAIPLARSSDGVVLCVALAAARLDDTQQVLQAIGESRFIGSVTMEP